MVDGLADGYSVGVATTTCDQIHADCSHARYVMGPGNMAHLLFSRPLAMLVRCCSS